jgi:Tol biopolymer transport system component
VSQAATVATEHVSVHTGGSDWRADAGNPYGRTISDDGKLIVFAAPIAFGTGNRDEQVYVHNRATGRTTNVSVTTDGRHVRSRWGVGDYGISGNGRFVVFATSARLTPSAPDGGLFIRDRLKGRTTRLDAPGGFRPSISADGRLVAFRSFERITPDDGGYDPDVFVRNRVTGRTTRISLKSDGTEVNQTPYQSTPNTGAPAISADGRFVAFASNGAFTADDTDRQTDVFVRDRQTGQTTRASVSAIPEVPGNEANADAPAISADGRFVAFVADNFTAGEDPLGVDDVYVRDMISGTTTRVSVRSNGTDPAPPPSPGGFWGSFAPTISSGGRYIAFESDALFDPNDSGDDADAFVHDRTTGDTTWVSVKNDDTEVATGYFLLGPFISGDGRFVAFRSSGQFTADDTDNLQDVFVRGPLF